MSLDEYSKEAAGEAMIYILYPDAQKIGDGFFKVTEESGREKYIDKYFNEPIEFRGAKRVISTDTRILVLYKGDIKLFDHTLREIRCESLKQVYNDRGLFSIRSIEMRTYGEICYIQGDRSLLLDYAGREIIPYKYDLRVLGTPYFNRGWHIKCELNFSKVLGASKFFVASGDKATYYFEIRTDTYGRQAIELHRTALEDQKTYLVVVGIENNRLQVVLERNGRIIGDAHNTIIKPSFICPEAYLTIDYTTINKDDKRRSGEGYFGSLHAIGFYAEDTFIKKVGLMGKDGKYLVEPTENIDEITPITDRVYKLRFTDDTYEIRGFGKTLHERGKITSTLRYISPNLPQIDIYTVKGYSYYFILGCDYRLYAMPFGNNKKRFWTPQELKRPFHGIDLADGSVKLNFYGREIICRDTSWEVAN